MRWVGLVKTRKTRVSAWEFAWVPGPVGLWRHGSVGWPCIEVRGKLCSFLSSLHWPSAVSDLGVGGVSFVELLILCERWAGGRLVLEMSVPKLRRFDRPLSPTVCGGDGTAKAGDVNGGNPSDLMTVLDHADTEVTQRA